MNEHINNIVVLEAIKVTGNSVPYPATEGWAPLTDEISNLVKDELLSIDSGTATISDDGKKVLFLFHEEIAGVLKQFEPYKQVQTKGGVIDARLPISAYMLIKSKESDKENLLFNLSAMIVWKDFFNVVKELAKNVESEWQTDLIPAFYENAEKYAKLDIWRVMGATRNEAINTCELLLNPKPRKDLIQINKYDA